MTSPAHYSYPPQPCWWLKCGRWTHFPAAVLLCCCVLDLRSSSNLHSTPHGQQVFGVDLHLLQSSKRFLLISEDPCSCCRQLSRLAAGHEAHPVQVVTAAVVESSQWLFTILPCVNFAFEMNCAAWGDFVIDTLNSDIITPCSCVRCSMSGLLLLTSMYESCRSVQWIVENWLCRFECHFGWWVELVRRCAV